MKTTALNEAQMSILRLLGSMKSVEEVNELRQVICDYYARRVDDEMDRLWEEGKWDNEKNEAILQEHLRTPYKHVWKKKDSTRYKLSYCLIIEAWSVLSCLERTPGRWIILCVSTDILEEYAEIITQKTSVEVASNVIHLLLESQYVELVNPYFSLHLIEEDHDDDKFVDCAFAANATFIVSDDKHYDVLQDIDFPKLLVLKLKEFLDLLQSEDNHNV